MSNNFIPHYSALPEERYLLEVNNIPEPEWGNYLYGENDFVSEQYAMDAHNYNQHVAQLKKYPMPQMPVEWKDGRVVELDKDFTLQHQWLIGWKVSTNGVWADCTKEEHDTPYVDALDMRRIIAVPIAASPEAADWISIKERPSTGDYVIKTLHEDGNTDIMRLIDGGLYNTDVRTDSAITHFIIQNTIRASPEAVEEGDLWEDVKRVVNSYRKETGQPVSLILQALWQNEFTKDRSKILGFLSSHGQKF